MLTVLGPTASGKTALAVRLAYELDGEIISADSRQVYRGMTIGTGKDLSEYTVKGKQIPYHLIDIVDPGYEYNVFEYQQDFIKTYLDITSRGKLPVLCGGSGMYLESVLKKYSMNKIDADKDFQDDLNFKSDEELITLLISLKTPHNTTDLLDRTRMIHAILINRASENKNANTEFPDDISSHVFGIQWDRTLLRERITARLKARLEQGMIEEVKELLKTGLTAEQIKFYGLEYRFIMLYLENKTDHSEMFRLLNIAIHQFAKRQMTWFRKMERTGLVIHWIRGEMGLDDKAKEIFSVLNLK
jgi:tRNA dimethylallyltransferase